MQRCESRLSGTENKPFIDWFQILQEAKHKVQQGPRPSRTCPDTGGHRMSECFTSAGSFLCRGVATPL